MQKPFIIILLFFTTLMACSSKVVQNKIDGRSIYLAFCAHCHDNGAQNAQIIGDKAGWKSRLSQGYDTLVKHSIDGYMGALGYMPPRGGYPELTDGEIKAAVSYIIEESR